jgi:hypothetical protein
LKFGSYTVSYSKLRGTEWKEPVSPQGKQAADRKLYGFQSKVARIFTSLSKTAISLFVRNLSIFNVPRYSLLNRQRPAGFGEQYLRFRPKCASIFLESKAY